MAPANIDKVKSYKTLQSLVYENLRDAILSGRLQPGARLVAAWIAEDMGVSRMPVRESLRRLESEGLVSTIPHKEAVVRKLSRGEIEEVYAVRLELEGFGGRLAAQNIKPEELAYLELLAQKTEELKLKGDFAGVQEANRHFHDAVFQASGSKVLFEMLANLWNRCSIYRHLSATLENRMEIALDEHRAIIDALRQGDQDRAEQLVCEHTKKAIEPLLKHLNGEQAEVTEEGYRGQKESLNYASDS